MSDQDTSARVDDPAEISWLRHHRIDLALHRLSAGSEPGFRPLLLLHGLGERTPERVPFPVEWPGRYERRAKLVRGEKMSWHS